MTNIPIGQKEMEQAVEEAMVEKAIAQGKFEIAVDVLHDIGNAVVGIGSYLTRIRRSMEQTCTENLVNLADFFADRLAPMGNAIGEAKAGAVVSMLRSMAESQRVNAEEIQKSITEQLNIITHIQDILNIQRQYVTGHESNMKHAVNLRSIINDCLSMLFASIDKRGIVVRTDIINKSAIVQGDRTKLMQVIMNILKNSIEAIEVNGVDKDISIRLYMEDEFLILEIMDSGNGFDEATGGLIFTKGFTTKPLGSGLGMNNCRTIVESHAGTISITSTGPGKGALTIIKFLI